MIGHRFIMMLRYGLVAILQAAYIEFDIHSIRLIRHAKKHSKGAGTRDIDPSGKKYHECKHWREAHADRGLKYSWIRHGQLTLLSSSAKFEGQKKRLKERSKWW